MPRKVFTAGEVLAASDVNSFLMNQTVMVFAGTAARGSAIGIATEGMYAHLNDTDTLTYYNGSAWVNALPASTSAILQVVSLTKTDPFTTTSSTFQDVTGLSLSITPSSATSKIFITGAVKLSSVGFATNGLFMKLLRNSTDIAIGDADGNRIRAYTGTGTNGAAMESAALDFLDSPATTSAVTYKIQLASNVNGQMAAVNRWTDDTNTADRPRGVSTITLMEVAG
jgi:hypothetical protein